MSDSEPFGQSGHVHLATAHARDVAADDRERLADDRDELANERIPTRGSIQLCRWAVLSSAIRSIAKRIVPSSPGLAPVRCAPVAGMVEVGPPEDGAEPIEGAVLGDPDRARGGAQLFGRLLRAEPDGEPQDQHLALAR